MVFMKRMNKGRKAFTMMEVLTGLAIISIITSVVLPGIANFYSSTRVKAEASILVSNIRMARYKAIQEQSLHRIIFHPDGGAYKIQAFIPDYDLDYAGGVPKSNSAAGVTIDADAMTEYESPNWASVIDEEERVIDPGIEIYKSTFLPDIIFFRPNGFIYYDFPLDNVFNDLDQAPLPECFVTLVYGSAAIRIIVNTMGVLSSEAYQVDDDYDFSNDGVLW
jgi:prepilin-type N-terminal cleavage/methylation domain-containing protein